VSFGGARLRDCLERLRPHVDVEALALTGGVALGVHRPALARLADVDFVAARMDAVRPSVTRELLVSHYHVAPDKPLVQLVDRATRLRIDVFFDRAGSVARATVRDGWRVVAAADLLAHKRALLGKPVDPKHWRDIVALAALCGEPLPPAPTLAPDVYCTDLAYVCARCERSRSEDFPLAPKQAIFDLIGYV
jgi:hypothetical protein